MTQAVARLEGEFVAVAKTPARLIVDILPLVQSWRREEIQGVLRGMNAVELNTAFERAVAARKAAGCNVTDQDIAATKAILQSPRVV